MAAKTPAESPLSKLRPVDQTALNQLPEKQRELLTFMIELGGSVIEVKSMLDDLGKGKTLDEVSPDMVVRELTFRRVSSDFDAALRAACGETVDGNA